MDFPAPARHDDLWFGLFADRNEKKNPLSVGSLSFASIYTLPLWGASWRKRELEYVGGSSEEKGGCWSQPFIQ